MSTSLVANSENRTAHRLSRSTYTIHNDILGKRNNDNDNDNDNDNVIMVGIVCKLTNRNRMIV